MTRLKSLIAAFAMACLLTITATASEGPGTMTAGGDRSSPPPPPPPTTAQNVDDAGAMLEPAPDADEASLLTFDVVGDAMIRLAIWVIW